MTNEEVRSERGKLARGIIYPLLFVAILWFVKLSEILFHTSFAVFGLLPRSVQGLPGIVLCPLIHGSINHLISNSLPLLVLGSIVFYFYRPIAFSVFFWVYLVSGVWLWAAGRGGVHHIGASGIVYGFVSFIFFSGIFRRNRRLLLLSLFVLIFYGSLIWGIFPFDERISWESHLLGSFAGIMTAWFYRAEGPQKEVYEWENEDEEDLDDNNSAETGSSVEL